MLSADSNIAPALIGESPEIGQIRRLIRKAALSQSNVLLLGESGTGKEVVARAIHDCQTAGEFVPIDCGSLVGPLMESELFGHTKGAFTGAGQAKKGLVEAADGGTAFFDEIGDLPVDLQVKLLRLLQERVFRPVGSTQQKRADFRVIAATHRNLPREIEAGRFRLDLYYRLNVLRITLPPLRNRKHDIPLLVRHFLARSACKNQLTGDSMDALMSYQWPGNVRELQNCIERMVATSSGPFMTLADLPSNLQSRRGTQDIERLAEALEDNESGVMPLSEIEKRAIMRTMDFTSNDRGKTAGLLGIGRTTLYRKLKEYNLED